MQVLNHHGRWIDGQVVAGWREEGVVDDGRRLGGGRAGWTSHWIESGGFHVRPSQLKPSHSPPSPQRELG